jgi:uncharacterized membrane protein
MLDSWSFDKLWVEPERKEMGMINYQGEVVVNRPVSEVFAYVTTFENFPKWTDTHSVRRLTNASGGVGTRLLLDMGRGPMRSEVEFDTTGWEPDRLWAFQSVTDGPIGWNGNYGFRPVSVSSTKVTTEGQVTLRGWRRLLEPIVKAELRRGEQAELEKLKGLIEGGS